MILESAHKALRHIPFEEIEGWPIFRRLPQVERSLINASPREYLPAPQLTMAKFPSATWFDRLTITDFRPLPSADQFERQTQMRRLR
jgi:hypothetical protein